PGQAPHRGERARGAPRRRPDRRAERSRERLAGEPTVSSAERAHAPKIAALMALAEERLSPSARARIERHLADCPVCRQALAAIVLHARIADDVRALDPPELDFSRMEQALEREAARITAQERAAQRRRRRPAIVAALALAAAAVLGLVWSGGRGGEAVAPPAPPVEPAAIAERDEIPEHTPAPRIESAPLAATVTLVAGRGAERVPAPSAEP